MGKKNHQKPTWERVAFLFQGGGALGSFQVGVFEALQDAGYQFDWVSGISIGAINAAIVSGNKPEHRVEKLKEFWQLISSPEILNWWHYLGSDNGVKKFYNQWHAQATLLLGQPGFFQPRMLSPHFIQHSSPDEISFYDTSLLRSTLEHLIDFDILNNGKTRLTLSAVRVDNGQEVHFDTNKQKIYPEHIMASGALPPGFPAVKIDGEYYWDGGVVNNTPIEVILNDLPRKNTLCFLIHLFDPEGDLPSNLDQVLLRHKDISYASNYKRAIKSFTEAHDMRHAISLLYDMLPDEMKSDPQARKLRSLGCKSTMVMVRFHRHHTSTDLSSKDYAFSPNSIRDGIEMGYTQAMAALKKSPWLQPVPKDIGAILYDMHLHETEIHHK